MIALNPNALLIVPINKIRLIQLVQERSDRYCSTNHRTRSASSVGAMSRTSCQLRPLAAAPMLTINPKATLRPLPKRRTAPASLLNPWRSEKRGGIKNGRFSTGTTPHQGSWNSLERTSDEKGQHRLRLCTGSASKTTLRR